MSHHISRRSFLRNTSIIGLGTPILGKEMILNSGNGPNPTIPLRWLDTAPHANDYGTTFGLPWAKGILKKVNNVRIYNGQKDIGTQSWPLAYWPDGSIKWSAHAVSVDSKAEGEWSAKIATTPSSSSKTEGISVEESATYIKIDTGRLQAVFNKKGDKIVESLANGAAVHSHSGRLVLLNKENNTCKEYLGNIENATVEQDGNVRTVVKITGTHQNSDRKWLPFTLRFYFYRDSDAIRIFHTVIFDGDENKDFIKGLGLRFEIPFNDGFYNRHVKFVDASNGGVFSESLQNLTGLRRDPGIAARKKQTDGQQVQPSDITQQVQDGLKYVPVWGEYSLAQLLPGGYSIKKRTSDGHSWLASHYGEKATGTGFVGGTGGGLSFGIRNFWQSFPSEISMKDMHTDTGMLNLWLWSPEAEGMDLRFYHDGLGEDSFEKQREALDITYEDYEPGFGSPIGVGRTSELWIKLENSVPSNEKLVALAQQVQKPLQLVASSDYMQSVAAFGNNWNVPSKDKKNIEIENKLAFYFEFYRQEVDNRNWYGFWNYGDVMHTYDFDRHNWRYDTGGFAWDNSELSTDLWLWYYFLRTGKDSVFRMAEAMTRHTGEVDVHHIGPFAPLGSRHNVMHWGDSAKQLRISTVTNRRFLYYLTADERIGDLMHEQVEAYKTLQKIAPGRKLPKGSLQQENRDADLVNMGFGTDWGSVAAAWFTEWERTKNKHWLEMLENSMTSIAEQPHGFFTGGAPMDVHTGIFTRDTTGKISVSHLNAVFGLPEILTEINESVHIPKFYGAWVDYCALYNAPAATQKKELGEELQKLNLQQGHARLTAYAAWTKKDKGLLQLAWKKFEEGKGGMQATVQKVIYKSPDVVQDLFEVQDISTNAVAQWCLAAMQCLAYDWTI